MIWRDNFWGKVNTLHVLVLLDARDPQLNPVGYMISIASALLCECNGQNLKLLDLLVASAQTTANTIEQNITVTT